MWLFLFFKILKVAHYGKTEPLILVYNVAQWYVFEPSVATMML